MSDQPTANLEDSDRWHDANSYYGDEMTDVSAARQRAERTLSLEGSPDVIGWWFAEARALARDVQVLADRVEAAEKERDEAHLALDNFNVPREEPHFRSPYKLAGRIRWLRSTLVIGGNQRAGALIDRAVAAEARVAELEKFAQHRDGCAALISVKWTKDPWPECNCGLDAALSPVSPNTEETT